MAQPVVAESHQIYAWDAQDLLKELSENVRKAGEANEALKRSMNADVVALG